ncbi:helix-hairpin-helix domain-containing protein [Providencia rettgeri]|uniref:helix-hairpin-helix domain-containing protein n=1 Tax=Providencia rettgeri TaxID=587 RepID=UPI0025573E48|nr:helix-hairpin-helix domain-containing protein [Providencia rettgeri]
MAFSESEKEILLAVKGVGPTVISRLEQMGFSSLAQLSEASYDEILSSGAALTGSSCWKNSPQAKSAVEGAILAAKQVIRLSS